MTRISAVLLALAMLLGFLGEYYWVFDLFSQFQVYYALFAPVLLLAALLTRLRTVAGFACAIMLLEGLWLAPFYTTPRAHVAANAPRLRLLQFNVRLENFASLPEIARYADNSGADLALFMETDVRWVDALRASMPHYELIATGAHERMWNPYFGICLFLRRGAGDELTVQSPHELFLEHRHHHPALSAALSFAGRPLTLLAVHQHPPISGVHASIRQEQYEGTGAWLQQHRGARVVFGDMNASPWSYPYRALLASTDLRNAQLGFGLSATWYPLGNEWFGLPLDHCLHGPELVTTAFTRGPSLGSDHHALRVDLAWADQNM